MVSGDARRVGDRRANKSSAETAAADHEPVDHEPVHHFDDSYVDHVHTSGVGSGLPVRSNDNHNPHLDDIHVDHDVDHDHTAVTVDQSGVGSGLPSHLVDDDVDDVTAVASGHVDQPDDIIASAGYNGSNERLAPVRLGRAPHVPGTTAPRG